MLVCLLFVVSITILVLPQAFCAADPVRDWKAAPAIIEINTTHDIYAIGDIHGDYERFVSLLVAHKIIADDPSDPLKAKWAAGKSVLVCTGDVIDKSDHAVRVIALLQTLAPQAEKTGGRVVVCMGNHEAEFLASEGKGKKVAEFVTELKREQIDLAEVLAARDSRGIGKFLRAMPFGCRINDWFFIHAGDTHGKTLPQLRDEFQKDVDANGFKAAWLIGDDSPLEARLHPHPWWERTGENAAASKDRLTKQVKALGVKHLVIGHQAGPVDFSDGTHRKKGAMAQKFDGLIFFIDVGMSRAVGDSAGSILHIKVNGKQVTATSLRADRSTVPLWRTP